MTSGGRDPSLRNRSAASAVRTLSAAAA